MFRVERDRGSAALRRQLVPLLAALLVAQVVSSTAVAGEPLPPLQQGVLVAATLRTAVRLTATVEGVKIQGGSLDTPEASIRVPLPQVLLGEDLSATGALAGLTVIENISIEGSDQKGDAYLLPVELFGEWSGPKSRRATISFRLPSTSWSALEKVLAVVGTQPSGADLRALAREADASGSMNISLSRRQTVPVFIGWFISKEGLEGEPTPLQGECEVTLQVP